MKKILKKITPSFLISFYHWFLAILSSLVYGFPSNKMIVIGVTGTAGKSTVINLIGQVLEKAGYHVGWTTTFNFKIKEKEWINKEKMTMLGRFSLQKLLKQMVKKGCHYAIIETTSQGIKQFRHLGINYDIGIFTGLAKEHLEAHGGWEKYRQEKEKLFKHISQGKEKVINNKKIAKTSIVNLDDPSWSYFSKYPVKNKYGYTLNKDKEEQGIKIIKAENIKINVTGSEFDVLSKHFKINLLGKFNISNSLAAISLALSQNIKLEVCQEELNKIKKISGRMEIIIKDPFTVIVDYAHTPDSLEKVFKTLDHLKKGQLISVIGSAGGGRDKWKRPVIGELAEKYCDQIIITNEDPYNEDPEKIIKEIIKGIKQKNFYQILDRRKAIEKALLLAQPGDVIVISGKGCEPWIVEANNKRIAWDDREIVKEILKNKIN